jgi:hypothetical protein
LPFFYKVNTEAVAGEGLILTAGGVDSHIHFICPQLADEAIASGTFPPFLYANECLSPLSFLVFWRCFTLQQVSLEFEDDALHQYEFLSFHFISSLILLLVTFIQVCPGVFF